MEGEGRVKYAPCPHCGTPGRRKAILARTVRGIAYGAILLVHATTAEYRARCGCGPPALPGQARGTAAEREVAQALVMAL
jgi:hypothetical protein